MAFPDPRVIRVEPGMKVRDLIKLVETPGEPIKLETMEEVLAENYPETVRSCWIWTRHRTYYGYLSGISNRRGWCLKQPDGGYDTMFSKARLAVLADDIEERSKPKPEVPRANDHDALMSSLWKDLLRARNPNVGKTFAIRFMRGNEDRPQTVKVNARVLTYVVPRNPLETPYYYLELLSQRGLVVECGGTMVYPDHGSNACRVNEEVLIRGTTCKVQKQDPDTMGHDFLLDTRGFGPMNPSDEKGD